VASTQEGQCPFTTLVTSSSCTKTPVPAQRHQAVQPLRGRLDGGPSPQASLSDIFQQDIFGKGPVPIMQNLWAQEVDADRRIKDYQHEIRKKILDMYGFDRVPEEIDNYIAAASAEPAMEGECHLRRRRGHHRPG
jgi:hypothetical protein